MKKEYIRPQVKYVNADMESLLNVVSGVDGTDNLQGDPKDDTTDEYLAKPYSVWDEDEEE